MDHILYYSNLDSYDIKIGDDEEDKNMIFKDHLTSPNLVECNDEGVEYIEARVVGIAVSQVIQLASSDIGVMEPFLPYEPYGGTATAFRRGGIHSNSKALLKIQVNVFDCGGMVICFSYSHKIVDASSFLNFVNDWAATSRGVPATKKKNKKKMPQTPKLGDKIEIATKRFVFKNSSIAKLKKKCIHVSTNNRSLSALTSLILMCIMDVLRFKVKQIDDDTIPPLPTNSFGNMIDTAIAEIPSNLTGSQYYPELVSTIRDSINLVDNEHVEAMKRNLAISCNHIKMLKMIKEGKFHQNTRELLMFSSWCRFPYMKLRLWLGKTRWASISKQLEAWVSLEEEDMVEFERHEELLAFAS
ncbi:hypothetical protein MKW92_019685 [Papaver armeniacum]|nr:hypothetical protein MKW92_019685 [Papaver armeniacum]